MTIGSVKVNNMVDLNVNLEKHFYFLKEHYLDNSYKQLYKIWNFKENTNKQTNLFIGVHKSDYKLCPQVIVLS